MTTDQRMAGWREWVSLPDLGVKAVKAKLDTGARTSALHAFDVDTFDRDGAEWVRFSIHPLQRDDETQVTTEAVITDRRWITNPGGRRERRLIIETPLTLGNETWSIELCLTDRDEMGMRMLLGRTAMRGRLRIDPAHSYLLGKRKSLMANPEGRKKVRRTTKQKRETTS